MGRVGTANFFYGWSWLLYVNKSPKAGLGTSATELLLAVPGDIEHSPFHLHGLAITMNCSSLPFEFYLY